MGMCNADIMTRFQPQQLPIRQMPQLMGSNTTVKCPQYAAVYCPKYTR